LIRLLGTMAAIAVDGDMSCHTIIVFAERHDP
jgi:hypothetical protein